MLASGVDLGSLFTWGHQAFTGETGQCPSHPWVASLRLCCHRAALHHLGANRQGAEVVWEVAEAVVCWSVIHVATEAQLVGQNGSLVEPTCMGGAARDRDSLPSAMQTSNCTASLVAFPGQVALCVREAGQCLCGNMIASLLPLCCLPSAPYTCAGFI